MQFLLPLQHFTGEANDHVVLIGLSVNRYGAECGAFDLHGLILFSKRPKIVPSRGNILLAFRFTVDAMRTNAKPEALSRAARGRS